MNSILDIIIKLPALIGVSIEMHRRVPQLYTVRDITYHLQMTYYWLKYANKELKDLTESVDLIESEGEGEHKFVIPTLIGVPEQLEYLKIHLTSLAKDTVEYGDNTPLPNTIKYKIERSYDNMMLALFNTDLSTNYYGQLAKQ